MKKITMSLLAVVLGGMTLASCGSKTAGSADAEAVDTAAVEAVLQGEGALNADGQSTIAALAVTGDAAADLKALAQEVAANATKYNATQWAEVKDKAAAILANVKAANLSGDEVAKLTETVNSYLNSSTASLASKALEAVTGSAPVQGAVEAVAKGQEAVDAANAKVEEGKAAVENAKATVDEKVQKGKEQVEATKKNVEAVGEAAKGTVDAAKKLLGK